MHKPLDRSPRETFYFKVLEIFGKRFRLPGLRNLRNPFGFTLIMLLDRLLRRDTKRALLLYELWLKEKLEIQPNWTFIDIGANVGQWAIYMANRVHKVIAIEPVKTLYVAEKKPEKV
jgi:hypothetical protein